MKYDTDNIIASGIHSDSGYEVWGWLAFLEGGRIGFANFFHCSCYGTAEALGVDADAEGTTFTPDWEGSIDEALVMAHARRDPSMPTRAALPEDNDYANLIEMYGELIAWWAGQLKQQTEDDA